ncbi:unnamed protein product [Ambrosiozyma monospora]|uniref:Unnamed protein product n=1 Tax=Ambrosiozyma monospora TaxID=43982 RepID=A0ACB5U407_AMBMO|nr:unnamed protein product [Ambrosiozyma monospora]
MFHSTYILSLLLVFQLAESFPTQIPITTAVTSTPTTENAINDIPSPTPTVSLMKRATTEPNYKTLKAQEATYGAMYEAILADTAYYSNANPDLYHSFQSIRQYRTRSSALDLYYDGVPDYLLHQCVTSFLTYFPSSSSFQSSVFKDELTSLKSLYADVESTFFKWDQVPITETPSMTSWDADVIIPTSDAYSAIYMVAKCKALVDDGSSNIIPHWRNEFFEL